LSPRKLYKNIKIRKKNKKNKKTHFRSLSFALKYRAVKYTFNLIQLYFTTCYISSHELPS